MTSRSPQSASEALARVRAGLRPFVPPRWARDPHVQTILGRYWGSYRLPESDERREVLLPDGDRLVTFTREPTRPDFDVVYLFHGLGGSTDSAYMPRTAGVFGAMGHAVISANHRGCGPGEGLAVRPYHSGAAADLAAVIAYGRERFPGRRHLAIGFSLSGNALLLLIGARPDLAQPDAAISVNAPIDLARAADLLETGFNKVYSARFVRDCRRSIETRLKAGLLTGEYPLRWSSSLKEVDDLFTAPMGGFRDRHDYYARASAGPHLGTIRVPAVLLTAEDDPFVDAAAYRAARLSPSATLHLERNGGHMGYLAADLGPWGSRIWLDHALGEYGRALMA